MKASRILKGSLLSLALLLASSAFAANKGSLQVYSDIMVGGKQLKAGSYNVTWEGSGNSVQLNILKGKNVVATAPAQMVTLPKAPDRNAAVLNRNSDGSVSLSEVRFAGKTYSLQVSEDPSGSASGASSK